MTDIESTLAAIESSDFFKGKGRLSKLLRMLAQHQINTPDVPLKAYTIGTTVFGRKADFDPSTDAIVRVEIGRLRTALQLFYSSDPAVPIQIDIPKGSYKVVFSPLAIKTRSGAGVSPEPGFSRLEQKFNPSIWVVLLAGIILAGVLLELVFHTLPVKNSATDIDPPLISVLPVKISGTVKDPDKLSEALASELAAQLSTYPWLSVTLEPQKNDSGASRQQNDRGYYNVSASLAFQPDQFSAVFLFVDAVSGEVKWQSRQERKIEKDMSFGELSQIVRMAAANIGRDYGALLEAETKHKRLNEANGEYACYLKMIRYFTDYRADDRGRFVACAESVPASAEAPSSMALALRSLARMDQARWYAVPDSQNLLLKANADAEAADLKMSGAYIVDSALVRSRGCIGNMDGAAAVAQRIVKQRPKHAIALTEVSFVHAFMLGNEDFSLRILDDMSKLIDPSGHPYTRMIPALFSLQKGKIDEARHLVGDVSSSLFPPALVFGLALSEPTLDQRRISNIKLRLMEKGFDTDERILSIVDNECWAQGIKALVRPRVVSALSN